jgi:hypothetical protein
MLIESHTPAEIVEHLHASYTVFPEQLAADVRLLLHDLGRHALIEAPAEAPA